MNIATSVVSFFPALSNRAPALAPPLAGYMSLVFVLRHALTLLVPLSLILTAYLYLYPLFHLCAFPDPTQSTSAAFLATVRHHVLPESFHDHAIAPFRLLALGDPQLEGDTSLPDPTTAAFPNAFKIWHNVAALSGSSLRDRTKDSLHALIDVLFDDIPLFFQYSVKSLDILGNDYYLAHIYRSLHWWAQPTHVAVLGDLVGSQWISDEEFEHRAGRYWRRVFRDGQRVHEELTQAVADAQTATVLGDDGTWARRIINVAGNHDIGYAGDLTADRVARFERQFGKVNYELRFQLPLTASTSSGNGGRETPELRIVVLNDMNLDFPATDQQLQSQSYDFINHIIGTSHAVDRRGHFTILLTHIPLYKDDGVCVDGPLFTFHDESGEFAGGVKEQNHLSRSISTALLEGIFGMHGDEQKDGQGMGRRGLIIAGHDHAGCDAYHYINQTAWRAARARADESQRTTADRDVAARPHGTADWQMARWHDAMGEGVVDRAGIPGVREITLRSMMGDFDGAAGLVSGWFDVGSWTWRFDMTTCSLGRPPLWWAVHVLDLVTGALLLLALPLALMYEWLSQRGAAARPAKPVSSSTGTVTRDDRAPRGVATAEVDKSRRETGSHTAAASAPRRVIAMTPSSPVPTSVNHDVVGVAVFAAEAANGSPATARRPESVAVTTIRE